MAFIGMLVNIVSGGLAGILLWIVFWLTIIVSGMIFLLSLCNAYNTMLNKFSILIWLVRARSLDTKYSVIMSLKKLLFSDNGIQHLQFQERGYILLCLLLYVIATIISFVSWGFSAVSKSNMAFIITFYITIQIKKDFLIYIYYILSILKITHLFIFQIFAYILVVLYLLHGMLRWKLYRNSLVTPPPADIHT